jgi:hypothetical protein
MTTETQDILATAANFARLAAESTTAADRVKFGKLAAEWALRAANQAERDWREISVTLNPNYGRGF